MGSVSSSAGRHPVSQLSSAQRPERLSWEESVVGPPESLTVLAGLLLCVVGS